MTQPPRRRTSSARAGVSLKPEHFETILAERPDVGFFEIHAENYMGDGGPPHRRLEAIRADYPLSLHGVGLSIGGPRAARPRPPRAASPRSGGATSRACSPNISPGRATTKAFFDDLLPLPYTRETLADRLRPHRRDAGGGRADAARKSLDLRAVRRKRHRRGRFPARDRPPHRLRAAARPQQCRGPGRQSRLRRRRLSRRVSARRRWRRSTSPAMPRRATMPGRSLRIDAHDSPVRPSVWALYRDVVGRIGATPTLIEWDNDVPDWSTSVTPRRAAPTPRRSAAQARSLADVG